MPESLGRDVIDYSSLLAAHPAPRLLKRHLDVYSCGMVSRSYYTGLKFDCNMCNVCQDICYMLQDISLILYQFPNLKKFTEYFSVDLVFSSIVDPESRAPRSQ